MIFGTKVTGNLQLVYPVAADDLATNPGEVYEITIHTEGIPDENTAITQALALEGQVADLKVLYVETHSDNTMTLQFVDAGPGAIMIGGLLTIMPALFVLAGIAIVGYLVYRIYYSESSWLLPLLIIFGGGAALFFFTSDKFFKLSDVTVRKAEEKEQKDVQKEMNLRELYKGAQQDATTIKEQLNQAKAEEKVAQQNLHAIPGSTLSKEKKEIAKDRYTNEMNRAKSVVDDLKKEYNSAEAEVKRLKDKIEKLS